SLAGPSRNRARSSDALHAISTVCCRSLIATLSDSIYITAHLNMYKEHMELSQDVKVEIYNYNLAVNFTRLTLYWLRICHLLYQMTLHTIGLIDVSLI